MTVPPAVLRLAEGVAVVEVSGEVDLAVREPLAEVIDAAVASGCDVVVDLHAVTFLDSSGLSGFARLVRELDGTDRSVAITGPSRAVRRLLVVAGFERLIREPDGEAAGSADRSAARPPDTA